MLVFLNGNFPREGDKSASGGIFTVGANRIRPIFHSLVLYYDFRPFEVFGISEQLIYLAALLLFNKTKPLHSVAVLFCEYAFARTDIWG